jgi:hypothetical protein
VLKTRCSKPQKTPETQGVQFFFTAAQEACLKRAKKLRLGAKAYGGPKGVLR